MNMTSDQSRVCRLYHGTIPIDLLPFGKISEPGSTINWPGKFRDIMKVQGFQEALDNAAIVELNGIGVNIVIPEMLVALKLSSWSLAAARDKDAMDLKLILENVQELCPDLSDSFHEVENESLLKAYPNDEVAIQLDSIVDSFVFGFLSKG